MSDPAAFAVGAFTRTPHGDAVNDLIGSMVRYQPDARATLPDVIATLDQLLASSS